MAKVAENEDVGRVCRARGQREGNAHGVDRAVRVEEQENAERTQERAPERALFHLLSQQIAAEHHKDGIDEVEYRRHARGKIAIGAKEQDGREPAAEKARSACLQQRAPADAQPALAAAKQREDGKREKIAQQDKAHRRYTLRVEKACPQRHTAEEDRAQNDAQIPDPQASALHTAHLSFREYCE